MLQGVKLISLLLVVGIFALCDGFQAPLNPKELNNAVDARSRNVDLKVSPTTNEVADWTNFNDAYKEESRKYRRTVFGHDDWYKHRSSRRHLRNLGSIFSSGVISGLKGEVLAVTAVATFVVVWNGLIGVEGKDAALLDLPFQLPNLCLNPLPFTVSSSALGLLLVFRTNAAYSRWKDARIQWGGTINRSFDLVRSGLAYIGHDDNYEMNKELTEIKKELTARTVAFARALKSHFRDDADNDEKLRKELTGLLGEDEADRIMEAKHRPLRVVQDLSMTLRKAKLSPMQLQILDKCVSFYCDSIGVCERIFKTPIPLIYTRHTSRFITTWLLTLPLALYHVSSPGLGHLAVIPEAAFIAVFFYGIEELGIQIEEPFSILPMEAMGDAIERSVFEMLYNDLGQNGYFDEGDLCDSKWC